MPNAHGLLQVDAVIADVRAAATRQLWQALSLQATADTGLPQDYLLPRLIEQEAHASSGIGNGVAIPHLRLRRLTRPYTLLARASRLIDMNGVDGQPVDLVFLMLSPAADVAGSLQRLARLSRLVRDEAFRMSLRGADNADAMRALLLASPAVSLAA